MEQKSKNGVSIIGGADGPTSIFIAGPSEKQPLKVRIKNSIYRYKRIKVEKTIVANPHSLSETVQYAKEKYGLTETAPGNREYIEQIKCLKESLILQHEPELLGEMKDIPLPDYFNEAFGFDLCQVFWYWYISHISSPDTVFRYFPFSHFNGH